MRAGADRTASSSAVGLPTQQERYEVEEEIARGGMGAVLRAGDRDLKREVAMKVMLDSMDERARARFIEEAQVTAQLEHPNIVPVHELGVDEDGKLFFTMKLVHGRSLGEVLKALKAGDPETVRLYTLPKLVNVLVGVCNAMAFAHSKGVIHRDLKPANIMLGDYGEVQVMDWGLAKVLGTKDAGREGPAPRIVRTVRNESGSDLTMEGSILGTPHYMAPEQAGGDVERVDIRSDVYSLGVILYEMLTLEKPVEGQTLKEILTKTARGEMASPERRAPGREIPRELSAIAMKALALARRERYQNASDLRRDLELYQEGRAVSAKADTAWEMTVKLVRRNKGASIASAVAAVMMVTLAAAGYWLNLKERHEAERQRNSAVQERNAAREAREEQMRTALAASEQLARQGIRAATEGRWDEARMRAEAAGQIAPQGPWGSYAAAIIAMEDRRLDEAEQALTKALAADPSHEPSRAALSRLKTLRGDLATARTVLDPATRDATWIQLERSGDALYRSGDFPGAEAAFGRALELLVSGSRPIQQRTDWEILINEADGLLGQRFYSEAMQSFQKALALMAPLQAPPELQVRAKSGLQKAERELAAMTVALTDRRDGAAAWIKCNGFYESIRDLPAENQRDKVRAKLEELNGKDVPFECGIIEGVLRHIKIQGKAVKHIQPLKGLPLTYVVLSCDAKDLDVIKGMPLTELALEYYWVSDLSALRGAPLKALTLQNTAVGRLDELAELPLETLRISNSPIETLAPLQGLKLRSLFLESLDRLKDLNPLKGMSLDSLTLNNLPLIHDLSPLQGMPLTLLDFYMRGQFSHLDLLRGMPLKSLTVHGCDRLTDLTALKTAPLSSLRLTEIRQLTDLSPLRGLPLKSLQLQNGFMLTDLSPLHGMPLDLLDLEEGFAKLADLGPLKGMPLTSICIRGSSSLTDLAPLSGMPLNTLVLRDCIRVADLTPLRGMPLRHLNILGMSSLSELSPLQDLPLETVILSRTFPPQGWQILRSSRSIRRIELENPMDGGLQGLPIEEFWKLFDLRQLPGLVFPLEMTSFIRRWLLLDPINLPARNFKDEQPQKEIFAKEFFAGQFVHAPKAGERALVEGTELTWHDWSSRGFDVNLLVFSTTFEKRSENSLFLGVSYLTCDRESPNIWLSIGSDDGSLWRLNGGEVGRVYESRGLMHDQNKFGPVTLKKGINVLTFAVLNGDPSVPT